MSLKKNGDLDGRTKAFRSFFRSALVTIVAFHFSTAVPVEVFDQTSSQSSAAETREGDLIHYGDLIDVDIVGNLEYDWRGIINPEGFLDGLILAQEPIYALCKTESEIASEITKQYSRVLRDPRVVVKVIDKSGRAMTLLLGAVRNQQRLRLRREARLVELLSLSGGISDTASGEITIFRPSNLNCFKGSGKEPGNSQVMKFTISQLLTGDLQANPIILSGDIITVTDATPIYVIGGVNTPRQISSRTEMTITHAIAAAGGIAKEGVESDITIYRRDGRESKTLLIDLKKIRSKQQDDVLVKPFDIIDVGQKGRSRSKYPPAINAETISRDIFKLPVKIVE